MNILTENTVIINREIQVVFQFVINMKNFRLWFPEVVNIVSGNSLEHGVVGKVYLETVKVPFRGEKQISLNVVGAEKNKIFITEGNFYPLLPKMIVKFSEISPQGTSLTWSMQSRNNNLAFKFLLLPLFRRIMIKRAAIGVQNLKVMLENSEFN